MNTLGIEMYEIIELEMDMTKSPKIETFRYEYMNKHKSNFHKFYTK